MTVHLGKGLEEIGERAFRGCTLIHHIFIPPCHQGDQSLDFSDCMKLTTAHLTKGKGLEEIQAYTLCGYTLIQHVVIPPSGKAIKDGVFDCCSNLVIVQCCNEIDEFVSGELRRNWWNCGVH